MSFFGNAKIYFIVIVAIVAASVVGGYFLYKNQKIERIKKQACTMEAKLCPDGSYVGRVGQNCEFSDCPIIISNISGIKGTVLLGPMCPVVKNPPDEKCADRPYKTNLAVLTPDRSQVVKEFNSDDNGKFIVDLAPGEYIITSAETANVFSRCFSEGVIKVERNQYTNAKISCDTGIR